MLALDSLLSDDERAMRALVRRVVDEHVRPYVAGWFEEGTAPTRELATRFGEIGLLGAHLKGYGCAGTSVVSYGLACMELEAGDSGVRSIVSVQGSLAMYAIWKYGSEAQKQELLPGMAQGRTVGCFGLTEPDHGSDPASMSTKAIRDGDDWVISGTKMWITNAPVADIAVVWARTEDGIRGFVVPTSAPGVTVNEVKHKLSLRASITGEVVLDGVRLPDESRLPEATGLKAPLSCLTQARLGIVFGSLGAAQDCLHTAISYATSREQFGRPIAGFQLTQAKLADMALELQKGFLLALHLGRLADSGQLRPEQVSVGKLNNVRESLQIARTCRTILGANGISLEYPVLRHANNLESVLTYEGTSEVHQLVVGQALTGIAAFS
jgi:glutaryl-CoA dehydrogenase